MAKFFNQIIKYIQNKTFDIVKVVNSNKSFLFDNLTTDLSNHITVLPATSYEKGESDYFLPFSQTQKSCGLTDAVILTGTRYSTKNLNNYACVWSSSVAPNKQVYSVDYDGDMIECKTTSTANALRPALTFSSISEIPPTAIKDYNDVIRITCGSYPQSAVSQNLQNELDYMLSNINESGVSEQFYKTGRKFSLYSKIDSNDETTYIKQFDEYYFNGDKYVRVDSQIAHLYVSLSNGQMITQRSEGVWLKVEPVSYVLNPTPNSNGKFVALSEKALVGGVPFDTSTTSYETSNLKIFNELRFLVECSNSQLAPEHYELKEGYKTISSGAFSGVKGLKSITLPHTLSSIQPDAFVGSEINNITYVTPNAKKVNYVLPHGHMLDSVGCYSDGLIVMSVGENKTNATLCYLRKDGTFNILNGVNATKVSRLATNGNLNIVFNWGETQKTLSNTAQRKSLPEGYVMEAIGTSPEQIKKYFETESTGISVLENKPWFKNLYYPDQVQLIRLFATLGGLEPDQTQQSRVLMLFDNMQKHFGNKFPTFISKLNLPAGTNHVVDYVMEYKHDKDNKIIYDNGVAQIKGRKQVYYFKQLYKFISHCYTNPNFEEVAHTVLTKYHDILSYYKHKLELSNPDRHENVNPQIYAELKVTGIDVNLVLDYMFSSRYHTENPELQTALSKVKKQFNLNYDVVSRYDRLITEAKVLEAKQEALSKVSTEPVRLKYFMPYVDDDTANAPYTYVWPPISSATAITCGQALGSCFRVNGKNESALIGFVHDKRDNLMLIFNSNNQVCGYMRVNYDLNNKGILIDTIELNDELSLNRAEHAQIWQCCYRGLVAMAEAMNADGKYVVERINCKPDPYNKVLRFIQENYPQISDIRAKRLEERHYSTKQDIPYQKYFSVYLPTEEQLVISSPELTKSLQLEGK